MRYYGFRRNDDNETKGRRLRSKNRRALRRIASGSARQAARAELKRSLLDRR